MITDINTWRERQINDIKELDKKPDFYATIYGKKIGELGGHATHGYIGKSTSMWDNSITYYAAKELKHLFQSWQWHCVFADDINKRFAKKEPETKVHTFKTLQSTINFLFKCE